MTGVDGPNVLFITLDQFRGDSLSCAGHAVVRTPNLDALAAQGTRFARHYTQATPCAPGRAGLYTGMYQMNHRVVANGTPLDQRFDNVALMARRAGYQPALFGYTDQSIDPRVTFGPEDPRLLTYEGLLPGMNWVLDLSGPHQPWVDHLAGLGYDTSEGHLGLLQTENTRPAEHGLSSFTTDRIVDHLRNRADDGPWFVHASYLRPHPPYAAPGHFSEMYDPAEVGLPIAPADDRHPFHDVLMAIDWVKRPDGDDAIRHLRAQYFGMISAVDHEVGRLVHALRELGEWERTIVVVTADHGEQLGDHGLVQKVGWFEESHHIPLIWRDPRRSGGRVVERFTESVDVLPTLAEAIGQPIPLQCDGLPLTPFLAGDEPEWWRDAASWEFDWRFALIPFGDYPWPWDRRLEQQHLVVRRTDTTAYVQFGDGSWLCFDIEADPTWRTPVRDPERILRMTQDMLVWRSRHADRTHTGLLVEDGGVGRWPDAVPWRN
jgi:arylsulfatase A-like enzyme